MGYNSNNTPRCRFTILNTMHGAHDNFQGGDNIIKENHAKTKSTNNIKSQDDSIDNSSIECCGLCGPIILHILYVLNFMTKACTNKSNYYFCDFPRRSWVILDLNQKPHP